MPRALREIGRFLAGLVIGDDWAFAVAILLGLGATWALAQAGDPAWWPLPFAVAAVVVLSVRRAIRRGA